MSKVVETDVEERGLGFLGETTQVSRRISLLQKVGQTKGGSPAAATLWVPKRAKRVPAALRLGLFPSVGGRGRRQSSVVLSYLVFGMIGW